MEAMKAYLLFTATRPVLVLTTYDFARHPELLDKLAAKTVDKFIAHEVPIDAIKTNYSAHFAHVLNDPSQTDEVKILDDDGKEIFTNIRLKSLSAPIYYEPE